MTESVKLLSNPGNYAVVQLPGRKFPGVVIQGDSLHSLVQNVDNLRQLANVGDVTEVRSGLAELSELLGTVITHYEAVCRECGIPLPYPKD
jgi:hypothetical protein